MKFADAVKAALDEALTADPAVVLVGESVRSGGVAGTTGGLLEKHGSDRVREVPIADRAAVAFALGLALGGKRPIVELSSAARLLASIEVLAEAGRLARRGEFAVPLIVRAPVIAGTSLDALGGLDGVTVAIASSAGQAAALIRAARSANRPVIVLEPIDLYGERGDASSDANLRSRVVRKGSGVVLAAYGSAVAVALDAADELDATVVDLVVLPVDAHASDQVRAHGRLVVLDDLGFAARVLAISTDAPFEYLESPPVSVPPDRAAVIAAVREALAY